MLLVIVLEATILALTLRKFSPYLPAAAAGQDGKVGQVLGAETPSGIAPIGTMSQLVVGKILIHCQQGLLVEQEKLEDISGKNNPPEQW